MKFIALNDTVLIRRDDPEAELSEGGVLKPEIAQQQSNRGTVVAIDEYAGDVLHVGDTVLFSRYGGTSVELDGEEFVLVNYKQIYLKLA